MTDQKQHVSEANLAEGWDPDGLLSQQPGRAGRSRALPGVKAFWRSLEEKEDPTRLQSEANGSDVVKQTIPLTELSRVNRRSFLTLSGAISTLAGIEGCVRRP